MNIDPGQIVTHIIGFLLACWLLKRYAWESVLGFVEKRRAAIAASFDQIEKDQALVATQKENLDREFLKIEETRRERIQEAAREADTLAGEIKEEARREALAAREKSKQDIALELDKANEVLKDRIIDAVIHTTEKMILERLDKKKHGELIDRFLSSVKVS
ncbi:MAG: F0F1 ATP synthase subunit B [Candidatus Krumholzibacteriia bacterium]